MTRAAALEHRILIERIALGTVLEALAAGDFAAATRLVMQSRARMRAEMESGEAIKGRAA
jgi:hypothetical protein